MWLLRVSATLAYPLREETQHFQITIQLLFPLASNIFVITSLAEFVSTTKPTKLHQNIHLCSPNYTKFWQKCTCFNLICIFLHITEVWPKLCIIISIVSMWNSAIYQVLTLVPFTELDRSADWVRMDSLKNFTTEENKYTLTGIEELEVAAAILVIFLVILVNFIWSDSGSKKWHQLTNKRTDSPGPSF